MDQNTFTKKKSDVFAPNLINLFFYLNLLGQVNATGISTHSTQKSDTASIGRDGCETPSSVDDFPEDLFTGVEISLIYLHKKRITKFCVSLKRNSIPQSIKYSIKMLLFSIFLVFVSFPHQRGPTIARRYNFPHNCRHLLFYVVGGGL